MTRPATQDFRSSRADRRGDRSIDAGGKPAANVEVLMATPTHNADLANDWGNCKAMTDAAGRFAFPDPGEPWAVIARSDAGYAFAEFPPDQGDAGTLRLRPWARSAGSSATAAGRSGMRRCCCTDPRLTIWPDRESTPCSR